VKRQRVLIMACVIAEHCIKTQETASGDVRPPDCIHRKKNTAYNAARQAQPGGSMPVLQQEDEDETY